MKRLGIILGIIVLSLFFLVFFSTSSVETTAYFDADYYHQTLSRLESARAAIAPAVTDSIQAGFAKVSITPTLNHSDDNSSEGKFIQVPLAGFGGREGKPATGIHDSVFVKAVALKVGEQTIILVSADLLIMPPNIVDSVTVLLAKRGIQREQVFYSATHTHSSIGAWGAGYVGEMFAGKENPAVERWIVRQVSQVVISAIDDLLPARIGTGNFAVGDYTSNRLIGESGNKNNDFSFIAIEQIGRRKALIGSYSAHATTLGEDNWEISSDYPGYWARKMEDTTTDYALFFAGSVGSQRPDGEGTAFGKAKYIGEALADSLKAHLAHADLREVVTFSVLSLKMQLPEYHIRLTANTNLATALSKKLLPFSDNVYVQAVRIGNMVWITTPGDFSGEYALQLKNSFSAYGYHANVTSFNGSYVGYIVPGRYFYLDEYEPRVMGWFGPNMGEYTMDVMRQISRAITGADNI
ncbi:MAG TPA: neutral/alkaline non-lysosomal ceramidase N-terminal domain-containing protein [Chryseosolibacter sp.]|nr:neutral/alkaline non-lysosomal ceramidase N-terminal domain-containing protein [Chryseosolibacter sp.]